MVTKRFTHVRGGRWAPRLMALTASAVHPRARGAMVAMIGVQAQGWRFTHVRGGRWQRDVLRNWGCWGSPTCAGGDGTAGSRNTCCPRVHPRARGAMGGKPRVRGHRPGSPTCAGGDGQREAEIRAQSKVHPRAREAMVSRARSAESVSWVHPRARGAMGGVGRRNAGSHGFTHVRGRRWSSCGPRRTFTFGSPTCAGGDGPLETSRRPTTTGSPTCAGGDGGDRPVGGERAVVHPRARGRWLPSATHTCSNRVHPCARGAMEDRMP